MTEINLLPPEAFAKKQASFLQSPLVKLGFVYCIFFLITNGLLLVKINSMEKQLGDNFAFEEILVEEERQVEHLLIEQEKILEEKEVLMELLNKQVFLITFLEKITERIPETIDLTNIEISGNGHFYLFGNGIRVEDIHKFIQNISALPSLSEINLIHLTQNSTGFNSFQIEIIINGR